jgi:outer membrane murein-binding lipoprotein Lpp
MKTHSFYLLAAAMGLLALAAPQPISGQAPADASAEVSPQVATLIEQLTAQNKQLAANQVALDAKIDALAETIRQARIFAARAGRGVQ